ncbi:MAG TPA: GAF domain-containing protein, partial [Actinomycetota bacterium]|nr:GAF domain-containing protein [Actinomycetota bacterium]
MANTEMYLVNDAADIKHPTSSLPRAERGISDLMQDLRPMQEATDLPDLFAGLARSVVGTLKVDACLVSLFEPDTGVLRDVAASVVAPARLNSVAEQFKLDDFPGTKRVIETGEPMEVSISDPDAEPSERKQLAELGFSRLLMSRFTVEGATLGTVEVYRTHDRPFRHDDSRQMDMLAGFASNTYSKIQLAAKLEVHYTETIEALVSAL